MLEIVHRANNFRDNVAVISSGKEFTYRELLSRSKDVARHLLGDQSDLNRQRVAFSVKPGFEYVMVQWGIWRAGGIAVPLNPAYPLSSVRYFMSDSGATIVVVSPEYKEILEEYASVPNIIFLETDQIIEKRGGLPDIGKDRPAMILYTSGTTGSPKGVVTTHSNIEAQISVLVNAWRWTSKDHIINVLPLHHVHGIINVVGCALWSGATCEFIPRFDPEVVLNHFKSNKVSLFMAVPTVYYKLIACWEALPPADQQEISGSLARMRLMVSGSAALPISVMEKWKAISSHTLLERYGMTEIGMAISNPYEGVRKAGSIGQPLPNVKVRLVNEKNEAVGPGEPGEIQVKGPGVFKEYWQAPEATRESFCDQGWFRTGDIAIYVDNGYKILGRHSVDIIKSGGYKISALEIEEVLRAYPSIKDCAVVGIPDDQWGEIIAAGLILGEAPLDHKHLEDWVRERLPGYKIPRKFVVLEDLPRNAMGKVTKNELSKLL